MPNIFGLRKGLYQPAWEACGPSRTYIAGVNTAMADLSSPVPVVFHPYTGNASYAYYPQDDAFILIGTITTANVSEDACLVWHPNGPTGTVTSATSLSITTNYTSTRPLAPYVLRLTGGTGAGQERTVASNTVGANTVFTVTEPWDTTPDATTTWVLRSGTLYSLTTGTVATGSFRKFDVASYTGSNLGVTGLPATWASGVGADMVAPCIRAFSSGRASSGGASTLTDTSKNWSLSWANYAVRITGGTGAGQVRTILSSTTNQLTVAIAWATAPDSSSTYVIEANEDHIYLVGNASSTVYRYTISTNTWLALTTSGARTATPGRGCTLNYVDQDPSPLWTDENACLNGRYLYSLCGGQVAGFDRLDISSYTWSAAPGAFSDFATYGLGTCTVYAFGNIYIQKDGSGSFYKYRPSEAAMKPFGWWPDSSFVSAFIVTRLAAKRLFAAQYQENGVTIRRIYCGVSNGAALYSIQECD